MFRLSGTRDSAVIVTDGGCAEAGLFVFLVGRVLYAGTAYLQLTWPGVQGVHVELKVVCAVLSFLLAYLA